MDKVGLSGKYKSYPEYKDSRIEWLGDIPSHWSVKQLKFLCSCNDEVLTDSTNEEFEIEYIDIGSVSATQGVLKTESFLFGRSPSRARRIVRDGDVIISTVRTYLEAIASISNPPDNLIVSTGFAVIRPNKLLDKGYSAYFLRAEGFIKEIVARSVGVSYPAINASDLVNIKGPVPDFHEQQKIASFLDHETAKIDTLIEKQQQLIKLLKEKRQAVISHAVTKGLNPNAPMRDSGVEWLGEVPAHWIKKIKLLNLSESNRGSFVNGPFGSDLLADELRDEGVPVVYIRDIKRLGYKRKSTVCVTPAKAEQLNVCKVTSGDVIISKVGDPPGDACIYPEGEVDAIITQDVIRIRVDRSVVNPEYLVMLLNSDFGQMVMNDISVEGTRKRVSLGDFKATKFVIPSLNDQDNIVDYVHKQCKNMDTLISKSENAVRLIRERRTALISAAVTGKIDVRDWVAPEPSNNKIDASLYGNGVDLNKEASL